MAVLPNGATMAVIRIWAPHITTRSSAKGLATETACRMTRPLRRHHVPTKPRARDHGRDSAGERRNRYHNRNTQPTTWAMAVPMAAPVTPSPAPGSVSTPQGVSMACAGYIIKKLNTTSRVHITTAITPGTSILPLLRSIAPAIKVRYTTGIEAPKMEK